MVVFVVAVDVGIAGDKGLAGNGSDGGTNAVVRPLAISWSGRDIGRAIVLLTGELVDHQRFEAVRHRVKVVDPSSPAQHVVDGDGETGVDDDCQDQNGRRRKSLTQCPRDRGDGSEQHTHDQSEEEGDEQEKEECSSFPPQVRQEVQGDVEDDGVEDLVGHVRQHGRERFRRGMVKGVSRVLLDNWPLGV